MKRNRHLTYSIALKHYKRYKRKYKRLVLDYHCRLSRTGKLELLKKRITRLYFFLLEARQKAKLLSAGAALTLTLFASRVNAQNFAAAQTNPFGLTDLTGGNDFSSPTFVDLDGDGDLDIVSGSSDASFYYIQNTGTTTAPAFAAAVHNPFGLVAFVDVFGLSNPAFADIDNDGDLDLIAGSYYGNFFYYQNTGTATAPAFAAPVKNPFGLTKVLLPTGGWNYHPIIKDMDGDGDYDVLTEDYYGPFLYFKNNGTNAAPAFAAVQINPFGLANIGFKLYGAPACADLDGDGDFDILTQVNDGTFYYVQNTGTTIAPAFAAAQHNPFSLNGFGSDALPSVALADLDNDGDIDMLLGSFVGNFYYFENQNPGGVCTGLGLWLKADAGTTGNPISAWADQSGKNANGTQATGADQPALTTNSLNFNPSVTFNGSTTFLTTPAVTLTANSRIFIVGKKTNSSDTYIQLNTSSNRGITELWQGTPWDAFSNFIENASTVAAQIGGTINSTPSHLVEGYNGVAQSFALNIGYGTPAFSYLNGTINEIAIYTPPSALSTANINQIESYLALKYGITLDATGMSGKYISSSGTSAYNNTITGYWNNIAGIGRDINSSLDQRISTTVNTAKDVTIATNNDFASSNGGARTALTNGQFLVWGDDSNSIIYTQTNNLTATVNYTYRICRGWKIINTGNVGSVNLQFNGIAAATGNYYLLGDDDGNFTNGGTSVLGNSATLTFAGITFPSGTSFFTVAFTPVTPITPIGPGGVNGTNQTLSLWLEADKGVTGNPVSSWTDQSTYSVSATQATGADQPAFTSIALNYNPSITFNGTTTSMNTPSVQLSSNSRIFIVGKKANSSDAYVEVGTGSARGITEGFVGSYWDTFSNYIENSGPGFAPGGGTLNSNLLVEGYNAATVSFPLNIGFALSAFTYLNGTINEMAIYNPPTAMSATNITQVESYMAIKYGLTLNATGVSNNYLSSAGTSIYNNTLGTFWNEIIGIGRDDNALLMQKQSHTSTDTTRLYINTLAATNQANAGTISNDKSFIMLGNDQFKMYATNAEAANVPAGVNSRLDRIWKITNTNFSDNYNIDITLNTNAAPGSVTTSDLCLLLKTDTNFTTAPIILSGTNGITISYSNPVITISGLSTSLIPINSTRYMVIASTSSSTPLPIELLSFDAHRDGTAMRVRCDWTTETETNNDYFAIERSQDATKFEQIGTVKGAGTVSTENNYTFYDEHPYTGWSYYRLKQVDYNGKSTYFNVSSVYIGYLEITNIYPNPATDNLSISITTEQNNEGTIEVYNVLGQIVYKRVIELQKGNTEIKIPVGEFANGQYMFKVILPSGEHTQKVFMR